MSDLPFPRSLPEFQRLFPDDAACAAYLETARWREGFVCPHCENEMQTLAAAIRPITILRTPETDALREAAFAYRDQAIESYEIAGNASIGFDISMLEDLGCAVAALARKTRETAKACEFVEGKPDVATLIDTLSELITDTIGAEAGAVVRAQARLVAS